MPTLPLPAGKWAAGHGWTSPSQITAWSGTWLEVGLGKGSPQAQTLLVLPEDWVVGRNGSAGPQSLAVIRAVYLKAKRRTASGSTGEALFLCVPALPWLDAQHSAEV